MKLSDIEQALQDAQRHDGTLSIKRRGEVEATCFAMLPVLLTLLKDLVAFRKEVQNALLSVGQSDRTNIDLMAVTLTHVRDTIDRILADTGIDGLTKACVAHECAVFDTGARLLDLCQEDVLHLYPNEKTCDGTGWYRCKECVHYSGHRGLPKEED